MCYMEIRLHLRAMNILEEVEHGKVMQRTKKEGEENRKDAKIKGGAEYLTPGISLCRVYCCTYIYT